VKVTGKSIYTGRTFAKKFVAQINAGHLAWARAHSRHGVVGDLRDWSRADGPLRVTTCVPSESYRRQARGCTVVDAAGDTALLSVRRVGWRHWLSVDDGA